MIDDYKPITICRRDVCNLICLSFKSVFYCSLSKFLKGCKINMMLEIKIIIPFFSYKDEKFVFIILITLKEIR